MPRPLSPVTGTAEQAPRDPPTDRRGRGLTSAAAARGLLPYPTAVVGVAAGAFAGLWFLPFCAGLVIGLIARRSRTRIAVPATVAVAVAGWAIPLAWQAVHGQPIAATARTVAALAGLPASAALMLGVTMLVAAIQAVTGFWLVRAIRGRAAA